MHYDVFVGLAVVLITLYNYYFGNRLNCSFQAVFPLIVCIIQGEPFFIVFIKILTLGKLRVLVYQ
jgi:hypothetical protein